MVPAAADSGSGSWEGVGNTSNANAAYHHDYHVQAFVLLILMVFWAVCFALLALLFSKLRAKYQKQLVTLYELGMIPLSDRNQGALTPSSPSRTERKSVDVGDILGFLNTNVHTIADEMGIDAGLYLLHMSLCGKFWGFHFLTTGIGLITVYQVSGFERSGALYAFSYGNVPPGSGYHWISVLGAAWITASTIMFVTKRQRLMTELKTEASNNHADNSYSSRFTVQLKNVGPMNVNEQPFYTYFDKTLPGQVDHVHVVMDTRELSRNVRAQTRCIRHMNAIATGKKAYKPEAYHELRQNLEKLQAAEVALRQQQLLRVQTRIVFVTFNSELRAHEFIYNHKHHRLPASELGIESNRAKLAPLPSDIYWENMGVARPQRCLRMIFTYSVTLVCFVAFMLIACLFVFFLGFDYMHILYHVEGNAAYTGKVEAVKRFMGPFLFYGVCTTFIGVTFLWLEEMIPPMVKYFTKFEAFNTKSKKQAAYMRKCYGHYLIYHLLMSTIFLGLLSFLVATKHRSRFLLECIGAFHCNRMMLTVAIVDAAHWLEGVKYFRRRWTPVLQRVAAAKMAMSADHEEEHEEQTLETEADGFFSHKFDYSRNFAETTAVFGAASFYSVQHPLIMAFATLYFCAKYTLDKYQIMFQYSKPAVAYGRRARSTTTYLLCSLVIGRVGDVVYFNWLEPQRWVGLAMLALLALSTVTLFTYVFRNQIAPPSKMRTTTGTRGSKSRRRLSIVKMQRIEDLKKKEARDNSIRSTRRVKSTDLEKNDDREDFLIVYMPPSRSNLHTSLQLLPLPTEAPDRRARLDSTTNRPSKRDAIGFAVAAPRGSAEPATPPRKGESPTVICGNPLRNLGVMSPGARPDASSSEDEDLQKKVAPEPERTGGAVAKLEHQNVKLRTGGAVARRPPEAHATCEPEPRSGSKPLPAVWRQFLQDVDIDDVDVESDEPNSVDGRRSPVQPLDLEVGLSTDDPDVGMDADTDSHASDEAESSTTPQHPPPALLVRNIDGQGDTAAGDRALGPKRRLEPSCHGDVSAGGGWHEWMKDSRDGLFSDGQTVATT